MTADLLLRTLLQSWRALLRQSRYLSVAVLTLALGVAGAATGFALVYQALLRPLPFVEPGQLVTLGMDPGDGSHIAAPAMLDVLQQLTGMQAAGISSAYLRTVNLADGDVPLVASALIADRGFLETLGVRPALGRNFAHSEDQPGAERVALVSHPFWSERMGRRRDILGSVLSVEGTPFTVIGVLPESLVWPQAFDLLTPMRLQPGNRDMDTNQFLVARLRPDVEIPAFSERVNARMQELLLEMRGQLGAEGYNFLSARGFHARPLRQLYSGDSAPTLWLLLGAGCCVLLIAGVNLINLILLRSLAGRHEHAVRSALGASRFRLCLPALAESLLIGLLGAVAGLLLAMAVLRVLQGVVPSQWLLGGSIDVTPATWAFAMLAAVGVAMLSTLIALVRGQESSPAQTLSTGGRAGPGRSGTRVGRLLVVAQVALAVTLLVGASLFIRSLTAMTAVPMGFDGRDVLTFTLAPVRRVYTDDKALREQTESVLKHLQALPWIERASASTHLPTGAQFNLPARLSDSRSIQPQYRPVSDAFFSTFRIALMKGRGFDADDRAESEPVCVVNHTFSTLHFGGHALGQWVQMGREGDDSPRMRIVGVVADIRQNGPAEPAAPTVYLPIDQVPAKTWPVIREFGPLSYAVRTRGSVSDPFAALQSAVLSAAPLQPIANVRPMDEVSGEALRDARLLLLLTATLAISALLLAAVGMYAVLAANVSARQRDFGLRAALGAQPSTLRRLVFRESGTQLAWGLGLGLLMALASSSLVRGFLFGVGPADPLALLWVLLLVAAAGMAASIVPAWRIARTPPLEAIRDG